ncbi:MAG: hypothetical protein A4E72_02264 [Syntrophus sp. PtaU1.Bin208]|nr:MAG: hypothetical protein A4E72_02264 [Syntrophus sp. PtaU1.Bin208]
MRLQTVLPVERRLLEQDVSRNHHARSLAADITRPDQPGLDVVKVFQRKVLSGKFLDPFLPSNHDLAEMIEEFPLLFFVDLFLQQLPDMDKKPIPVIEISRCTFQPFPRKIADKLPRIDTAAYRCETGSTLQVREKHGRKMASHDLQGMDVNPVFHIIDIQEDLGRFPYSGDGSKRMVVAQQGEVGDSVELVEVGAGDPEEIADHQICSPGGQKIRKGVKNIKDPFTFAGRDVVNIRRKRFEAALRIKVIKGNPPVLFQERLMLGKTQVNNFPVFRKGALHERLDKGTVVRDGVNLPDDIVADSQTVYNLV